MKKLFLIIVIFSISLFGGIITQSTDIKTDGKNVMIFFSSSNCPYCEQIKKI